MSPAISGSVRAIANIGKEGGQDEMSIARGSVVVQVPSLERLCGIAAKLSHGSATILRNLPISTQIVQMPQSSRADIDMRVPERVK